MRDYVSGVGLQQRINKAANFTWEAIGSDILQVAEVDSMPREAVIEVVIDCDYMERYGDDREAVAAFRKLPADEQLDMLRKAFRCKHYGF